VASEQIYELLVVAAVLVGVVLFILLVAIRRLRRRKAELLGEIRSSPRLNADRAFNRLEMARREAAILARQGTDVSSAQSLIARSQSAFDLGRTAEAYELAQSAHETLVAIRHGVPSGPATGASPSEIPLPRSNPTTPRTPPNGSRAPVGASVLPSPSPSAGLPKHQMEAQFEMRLLDSDLSAAGRAGPADPATLAAREFQTKAQSAFAIGHYSEAFSYALKGRRHLGGTVGSVAPAPGTKPVPPDANSVDPDRAAEQAASASRCPYCGYPTTADDAFCRGCGTPRSSATCPQCGTPRVPADTFCGKCGARFS
jgi:hypothetical protein